MADLNNGRPLPPVNTRWKKGTSGNPRGRPKKQDSLTKLLREELEKVCPADREGRKWKELLIRATLQLAMKGKPMAFKEVWERLEGKVPQTEKVQTDARLRGPQPKRELSIETLNAIRDIYGLPPEGPETGSEESE